MHRPDVVDLAVSLTVSHKAGPHLIEQLTTFDALEARGVPFEVGRHAKEELVVDC